MILAVGAYLSAFWIGILMPFDFGWPSSHERPDGIGTERYTFKFLLAAVGHLVFFIPVGALSARARRARTRRTLYGSAVGLAVTSELAQLFVSRGPSVEDLAADLLGVAIGVYGARWYDSRSRFRRSVDVVLSPGFVGTAFGLLAAVYVVLAAAGVVRMASWDPRFPLVLGNEATADRPWRGELLSVAVFDRALSPAEANDLATAPRPERIVALQPVLYYPLEATAPTGGRLENHAPGGSSLPLLVEAASEPPVSSDGTEFRFAGAQLVTSRVPARELVERIQVTDAFTVAVTLQASDPVASGPARIVTVSDGVSRRNFTLAQEGSDLHFRVRNSATGANGIHPHLVARGVVEVGTRQSFVAVADPMRSHLYADRSSAATLRFSYLTRLEAALFGELCSPTVLTAIRVLAWLLLAIVFGVILRRRLGTGRRLPIASVSLATLALALAVGFGG